MVVRRPSLLWWTLPIPLVVAGSLGANHDLSSDGLLLVGLVACLAAICVPGAVYHPEVAVILNGFTVSLYFAGGASNGPIYLTAPLTALSAALRARPRVLLPWVGAAMASVALGLWVRVETTDASPLTAFWQGVGLAALTLAACALGWWWADRRDAQDARLRHAATEERLRMAQDLHDGVGHGLAVIAMQAGVALHVLDKDPRQARVSLEAIRDTSREALTALRAELARISASEPGPRRPGPDLEDLPALVQRIRAGGLDVTLRSDVGEPVAVPEPTGRAAYAVVQESLTNVLRHAGATSTAVAVRRTGRHLEVTVEDDGRTAIRPGVVPAAPDGDPPAPGMGLAGMRSRVEGLGGHFDAGPAERGFRVHALIPLPPEAGTDGGAG